MSLSQIRLSTCLLCTCLLVSHIHETESGGVQAGFLERWQTAEPSVVEVGGAVLLCYKRTDFSSVQIMKIIILTHSMYLLEFPVFFLIKDCSVSFF